MTQARSQVRESELQGTWAQGTPFKVSIELSPVSRPLGSLLSIHHTVRMLSVIVTVKLGAYFGILQCIKLGQWLSDTVGLTVQGP